MIVAGALCGFCTRVSAHEVRPGLLEITEHPGGYLDVLWKRPTMGMMAVHLVPHIEGGLLDRPPSVVEAGSDFAISYWRNINPGTRGLEGRTLSIEGLDQTITDVLVSVKALDGKSVQHILTPQATEVTLHLSTARHAVLDFLMLGIRHILMGPDHLLFVLGLMLIVRERLMLLKTVSAFTLAHSITLAAATLGAIRLSVPLLNTLVALSILFVGVEVVRTQRGGTSLSIRYPWVVAFAFGLLHGMGFATGLTSLGLEKGALLLALVLFNLGVEIGQLAFIALVVALKRAFRLMEIVWPRPVEFLPAYVIGSLGATWTVQYGTLLLGVS